MGGVRRKISTLTPGAGSLTFDQGNSYVTPKPHKPKAGTVSDHTHKVNQEVLRDLFYLRTQTEKGPASEKLGAYAKYEKYNCAEILAKAQMEQESMQYALKRLICSEDQS